jgi:hypothetical protein
MMSKKFEMMPDQLVFWQRTKSKELPLRDVFVLVKLLVLSN